MAVPMLPFRAVLLGIGIAGSAVHAQTASPSPLSLGFAVVGGVLSHSRPDGVSAGFSIEAQYQLPSPYFAVRGDIAYQAFAQNSCVSAVSSDPAAFACDPPQNILFWSLDLVARLAPTDRWSPYFLGGGALYTVHTNGPVFPGRAGVQVGVGIEARVGTRTFFFFEGRYMTISPGEFIPITIGMRF
jgi:hypothetical protein